VFRRSRLARRRGASDGSASGELSHRHPAMSGINVSPVHGRHCICDRCSMSAASRE
jgi:hypothetical protein